MCGRLGGIGLRILPGDIQQLSGVLLPAHFCQHQRAQMSAHIPHKDLNLAPHAHHVINLGQRACGVA